MGGGQEGCRCRHGVGEQCQRQDYPPQEGKGHNRPKQGAASSGQGGNQFSVCPTLIVWHGVCQEGQGPRRPGQGNEGVSPHQARHQVAFPPSRGGGGKFRGSNNRQGGYQQFQRGGARSSYRPFHKGYRKPELPKN